MSERIFKYPIAVADEQIIYMPVGATILTVHLQHGFPHVWAKVNPEVPSVPRKLFVVGTGQNMPKVGKYIGTFQQMGGELVWHVFDEAIDVV